jgi:hypothetical protein
MTDLRTERQPACELVLHPGYDTLRVQAIALKYQSKFHLNLYIEKLSRSLDTNSENTIKV